ncbi:MAG: hypothetical protein M4579_002318 [Chaenotheca gracillima]|nr:MAG: hypothetical protein M4579_002318 [Chaenotheca gracillima]
MQLSERMITICLIASTWGSLVQGHAACANQDFVACYPEGAKTVQPPNMEKHPERDRNSTEYAFADGSTGSMTGGNYVSVHGNTVNLVTGNYWAAEGQEGNNRGNETDQRPYPHFDPHCSRKPEREQEAGQHEKAGAGSLMKPAALVGAACVLFAGLMGL